MATKGDPLAFFAIYGRNGPSKSKSSNCVVPSGRYFHKGGITWNLFLFL